MGLRLFRRFRLIPGITLNLSKKGISTSIGEKGARFTFGRGGVRSTLGLPGTGLYYTHKHDKKAGVGRSGQQQGDEEETPLDRLSHNWLDRLLMGKDRRQFLKGMRAFYLTEYDRALAHFHKSDLVDSKILRGFLLFERGLYREALNAFKDVEDGAQYLGSQFEALGITFEMEISVTKWVKATIRPDLTGLLYGFIEVYQRLGSDEMALRYAHELMALEPDEMGAKASAAEVYLEQKQYEKVLAAVSGVQNEGPEHASLIYSRAIAMNGLGFHEAAMSVCMDALRKKKGMPLELMFSIKLEKALSLKGLAEKGGVKAKLKRAKLELQKLYAESPENQRVIDALAQIQKGEKG